MIEYPKIETLYDRDEKTFKVVPGKFRLPEFRNIKEWHITEKVDGTNIRAIWNGERIVFGGRTNNAQIPPFLLTYLTDTFTPDVMGKAFSNSSILETTLFGEGYGERIQKFGGNYRKGVSFRLFDVKVGNRWLEWRDIVEVAQNLKIQTVPELGFRLWEHLPQSRGEFRDMLLGGTSLVANENDESPGCRMEGCVARTIPMLFTRTGDRLMWKLKFKDFG